MDMSKGLNSLDIMVSNLTSKYGMSENSLNDFRNIRKELEALEILKKFIRIVDSGDDLFPYSIRDEQYVSSRSCKIMSEKEYNLLKEVL